MLGLGLGFGLAAGGVTVDPATADSIGAAATALNSTSPTFTRATSAYDPTTDTIVGPDVRRTRTQTIGTTSYSMDLIEGSRTNLLASGTSGRFERWTAVAGGTATADTVAAPNGEVIGQTLTDPGASLSGVSQAFTVANDSLPHCFSIYVLKTTGGTAPTFGIDMALTVGTGVTTSARINTDLGTQQYGSNSNVTIETPTNTAWWRIICKVTNNTTGNTTLTVTLYPAAAAYGASVDDAAATGTAKVAFACLNKASFISSHNDNRNLLLQTQAFGTTWSRTDTTATSDTTANPTDGAANADTLTEGVAGTAFIQQSANISAGATMTASIYLLKGNNNWIELQLSNGGLTNGSRFWVNLGTGAAGSTTTFGTGISGTNTITAISGGWYRVKMTGADGSGGTTCNLRINSASADASTTRVNNATYIAWGAQLVYGTVAQNYWANTTAVGLRVNDALFSTSTISTVSGSMLSITRPYGWSNDQDGATAFKPFCDHANTGNLSCGRQSSTTTNFRRDDGATEQITPTVGYTNGANTTFGGTWAAAGIHAYLNGQEAGTAITSLTPPFGAVAATDIGCSIASQQFYGWVLLLYWDVTVLTPGRMAIFANGVAA